MNKYFFKLIRKLRLNKALYPAMSILAGDETAEISVDDAFLVLKGINPDSGCSCIRNDTAEKADIVSDIDIIIPCYNSEKYLNECIDSVRKQKTVYSWRIIAIDDGSTDSTGAILDEYAAADKKVLVWHQDNKGFSGARNAGIRLVRAKYIYFLDSDDVMLPGMIEALISCAEKNGADAVEGAYSVINIKGKTLSEYNHKDGKMLSNGEQLGFPCGKVYKSSVFDRVEFPEGYWYEDSIIAHIIFPQIELNNGTVWGTSAMTFGYRINPEGISRSGREKPKCIDALWIHLRMYDDRKKLGIKNTQQYYEYILKMLVQTWHRTENQPEQVKKAIFVIWKDFLEMEFSDFNTENAFYKNLEKAVRAGDYGRYALFCKLN